MIVLGFVFGCCMFYHYYKTKIKYHGPNSNKVKKTIHKDTKTGKCYMFEPKMFLCPLL